MRACAPRSAICSDSAAMRWRRCTTRDFAAARITRSPRCVAPRVVSSVSLDLDFSNIRRLGVARPDHPGQMRADPEKSQMGSSARAACPMLTVRPDVRRVGRSEDTRWAERSLSRPHAPNNVAKPSLIPDSVVSRARLRPKYGQGWQPRLDPRPRQADGRGLGEEEPT